MPRELPFERYECRRCGDAYWSCCIDDVFLHRALCLSCIAVLTCSCIGLADDEFTPSEKIMLTDKLLAMRHSSRFPDADRPDAGLEI